MSQVDPASGLRPIDVEMSARTYLEALWSRRDFMVAMPAETLRSRHQNTLLGNLWHLANPMLTVGVYALIFGVILGVNRGVDNYLLWLTVGVFAYQLVSGSIMDGASSISSNEGLVRAVRFPRALLPMASVIGQLATFSFQVVAVAAVAVLTGAGLTSRLLVLPLILVVQTMLGLGGAFVAARLNDSFRDVQRLIPFLFRLLQFASGVMFPLSRFEETNSVWAHRIVAWNPVVQILEMHRWVFLGTPISVREVVQCTVVCALTLVLGFRFFVAAEHRYGRP